MSTVLLNAADEFLSQGISCFPVIGKEPDRGFSWKPYQTDLADPSKVNEWFGNGTKYTGLAVVSGPVSGGLAIRDFDQPGIYEQWCAVNPSLAHELPTAQTSPGRTHVWCRQAPGSLQALRSEMHKEDGNGAIVLDGGELRADSGCYTLAPPSAHPKGGKYHWSRPLTPKLPEVDLLLFLNPLNLQRSALAHREHSNHRIHKTLSVSAVSSVCQLHQVEQLSRAILETIPNGPGIRNRSIFEFARRLKSIPEYSSSDLAALKCLVQKWHEAALPFIATKPFSDTWLDFAECWPKVKFASGKEPIRMAYETAISGDLPEVAKQYEEIELQRLVALCRELQRSSREKPFYLSGRIAANLLGVPHQQAARWLRLLIVDGILELVLQGTRHKASEYFYKTRET